MIDLIKIDPFLCGYFENETLEHGERVGKALLCAAKNLPIKFSRQLLPETAFVTESGSSEGTHLLTDFGFLKVLFRNSLKNTQNTKKRFKDILAK